MLKLKSIPVDKDLDPYINRITLFKGVCDEKFTQRLMPSMFSYLSYNHKNIPIFKNSTLTQQPEERLQVIGPKTDTEIYVEHFGLIEQIIIEFSAYGFMALIGRSPSLFCNKLNNYGELIESNSLQNDLRDVKHLNVAVNVIQQHLKEMIPAKSKIDSRIIKSIQTIKNSNGLVLVNELSAEAGLNNRHFNRSFKKVTGVSPKVYIKIHQLHKIIAHLATPKNLMIDVALNNGFFDQPHFNRRFKELVNLTPREFLKSGEHVSLEYFSN